MHARETFDARRHPSGMEEEARLNEPAERGWKTWGPYLSERQWGTVREDYSPGGNGLGATQPRRRPQPGVSLG